MDDNNETQRASCETMRRKARELAEDIVIFAHYDGDYSAYWAPADSEAIEITADFIYSICVALSGSTPPDIDAITKELTGAYRMITGSQ